MKKSRKQYLPAAGILEAIPKESQAVMPKGFPGENLWRILIKNPNTVLGIFRERITEEIPGRSAGRNPWWNAGNYSLKMQIPGEVQGCNVEPGPEAFEPFEYEGGSVISTGRAQKRRQGRGFATKDERASSTWNFGNGRSLTTKPHLHASPCYLTGK